MIDTHAVIAGVEALSDLVSDGQGSELRWLEKQMHALAAEQGFAFDGSYSVRLPGKSARTVILGSSVGESETSRAGLVITGETLKALARRYGSELPCSVQLKVRYPRQSLPADAQDTKPVADGESRPAAYLELQMVMGDEPGVGASLSVVSAASSLEGTPMQARLIALGDEAIRELTGDADIVAAELTEQSEAMLRQGVATGVMYSRFSATAERGRFVEAERLQLLQAAEAFGRWAESTVHLVGGDEVDLWAQEHRLPHID